MPWLRHAAQNITRLAHESCGVRTLQIYLRPLTNVPWSRSPSSRIIITMKRRHNDNLDRDAPDKQAMALKPASVLTSIKPCYRNSPVKQPRGRSFAKQACSLICPPGHSRIRRLPLVRWSRRVSWSKDSAYRHGFRILQIPSSALDDSVGHVWRSRMRRIFQMQVSGVRVGSARICKSA